jgi:hypothetical protein
VRHVFDDLPERRVQVGAFDDCEAALALIERCSSRRKD